MKYERTNETKVTYFDIGDISIWTHKRQAHTTMAKWARIAAGLAISFFKSSLGGVIDILF